jgi:hypothetical protein
MRNPSYNKNSGGKWARIMMASCLKYCMLLKSNLQNIFRKGLIVLNNSFHNYNRTFKYILEVDRKIDL